MLHISIWGAKSTKPPSPTWRRDWIAGNFYANYLFRDTFKQTSHVCLTL